MRDAVAAQVTGSVSAGVAVAVTIRAQAPADRAGPSAARVRAIGVVEVLGDRLIVAIEDEAQHLRLSEHAHRLAEQPGRRLVRVDDDEEAVDTAADDAAVGHGDDRRRVDDHVVEAAPGFVHHLMQAARLEELVGRRLARPRGNDRQVEHRQLDDDVVQGGAGASLDDVIVELPMFNLSIIPSGPRQSAAYELLKSSRLHQMMDEARRRFDYVIVDTPPVIAVPDCRVISSGVDGFLVIVNAHKTATRLLSETVSVLGQSKVLGLIFNRDDQPIAEHLYNSYGPDPSGGWTGSIRRRLRRNGHGNGNASGNGTGYLSGNGITH